LPDKILLKYNFVLLFAGNGKQAAPGGAGTQKAGGSGGTGRLDATWSEKYKNHVF
jgi:hypothetical protein